MRDSVMGGISRSHGFGMVPLRGELAALMAGQAVISYGVDWALHLLSASSDAQLKLRIPKICMLLMDNFAHQLIALLSWSIFCLAMSIYRPAERDAHALNYKDSGIAMCVGGLIDADHFIAAGSLSLHGATNLSSRPFAHAVVFIVITFLILYTSMSQPKYAYLFLVAALSHQLRDATRRGLWLAPFGSTYPIPYMIHVLLLMATPCILAYIVHSCDRAAGARAKSSLQDAQHYMV